MSFQIGEALQLVTLVTLITGLAFGIMEVRRAHRERADKGALDVLSISVMGSATGTRPASAPG